MKKKDDIGAVAVGEIARYVALLRRVMLDMRQRDRSLEEDAELDRLAILALSKILESMARLVETIGHVYGLRESESSAAYLIRCAEHASAVAATGEVRERSMFDVAELIDRIMYNADVFVDSVKRWDRAGSNRGDPWDPDPICAIISRMQVVSVMEILLVLGRQDIAHAIDSQAKP